MEADLANVPLDAEHAGVVWATYDVGAVRFALTSWLLSRDLDARLSADVISHIEIPADELEGVPAAPGNEDDHHDLRTALRHYYMAWLEDLSHPGCVGRGAATVCCLGVASRHDRKPAVERREMRRARRGVASKARLSVNTAPGSDPARAGKGVGGVPPRRGDEPRWGKGLCSVRVGGATR